MIYCDFSFRLHGRPVVVKILGDFTYSITHCVMKLYFISRECINRNIGRRLLGIECWFESDLAAFCINHRLVRGVAWLRQHQNSISFLLYFSSIYSIVSGLAPQIYFIYKPVVSVTSCESEDNFHSFRR